jgi:hypothetical protein
MCSGKISGGNLTPPVVYYAQLETEATRPEKPEESAAQNKITMAARTRKAPMGAFFLLPGFAETDPFEAYLLL